MRVDVAIIGGGVMGCGLAWRLGQLGLRVAVIELSAPGAEASSAAAGILSAQAEAERPGPFLDLALYSRRLYPIWQAALFSETGIDIGYRANGVLMLCGPVPKSPAEFAELEHRWNWQKSLGLCVERLDRAELLRAEKALAPCDLALRFPEDGQVDPRRLCAALLRAAQARHAQFIHARVECIEQAGGRVTGLKLAPHDPTGPTQLFAERVVLAAGSWSSTIAGSPLPKGAITPIHGQVVEVKSAPELLQHVVFGHAESGVHGYLVPRADGRVLIGATTDQFGYEKRVTIAGILGLLHLGAAILPPLMDATFRDAWSGLRPASADGLPLLGQTRLFGLYACTGHYRNGILLAPASCEALAAMLVGADHGPHPLGPAAEALDLRPFDPSRLDNERT